MGAWSRHLAVVLGVLVLAGCGFQPVYGPGPGASSGSAVGGVRSLTVERLAVTRVAPIADREGQMLRNLLIDRLYVDGVPAAPLYELRVGLRQLERGIDIDATDAVTRTQLVVNATSVLVDRRTGAQLWRANDRAIATFNVLDSPFATVITRQDAQERAVREISEFIVTRLSAFYATSDLPEPPEKNPENNTDTGTETDALAPAE